MYKSQLQEYAQKAGLIAPTYEHVKEGASHEPRFKSTVWVNSQKYDSAPGFLTVRAAEHAAAKVALDYLQKNQTSGITPSAVHESGLCKNLLQEYAQKHGNPLPQYQITRQGKDHSLTFSATVEIAGVSYRGGFAKSKKEAEIKAARTALLAIQATQPANGSTAVEVPPLPEQSQPCQVTNFIKAHAKKKKRGRLNPAPPFEEPLATRMKQGIGYVAGPIRPPQMYQIPVGQVPQHVPMGPQIVQIPPQYQQVMQPPMQQGQPMVQMYQVNPVGYSGEPVMPVQWNQELGVCTRPIMPVQVVTQDPSMLQPKSETMIHPNLETVPAPPAQETAPGYAVQETAPTYAVQETAPGYAVQETAPIPVVVQETKPTLAFQETAPTQAVYETMPIPALQETVVIGAPGTTV